MITKERLEELIKQEADVYVLYGKEIRKVNTLDFPSAWKRGNTYKFNDMYETKEEAEFVAKNHDTRIEKFEPPFKLTSGKYYKFRIDCGVGQIYHDYKGKYYEVGYITITNSKPKYFKTYQKAVDYAHKLFKGEK